ncbi:MAG: molybdenum cofactor guanylyltransferase, partial [Rhodobacteraceae bacterium]|nr:molybdenum cofactor guanylyltransferase [Paracoccaceae bacterium]
MSGERADRPGLAPPGPQDTSLPGVILAGGKARRMGGGDKTLLEIGGRPILSHVVERLAHQAFPLALNANGPASRFAGHGLPVLPDPVPDWPGPLGGILAAMLWARGLGAREVLTAPADAPFLPRDLVAILGAARCGGRGAAIVLARTAQGLHPVAGLWHVALAPILQADLAA